MSTTSTAMDVDDTAPAPTGTLIKNTKSKNLHWVESFRPSSLDDVIGQEHIVHTLKRLIAHGDLPHLLFYGPPGTGKTSTILAIAKQIYGDSWRSSVLELNASDDRGISTVRNEIQGFAGSASVLGGSRTKLVILDEADSMTSAAQAALRRIIEKYTKNTRFCMVCNYLSKIIPALQSRCTRFRFQPLPSDAVVSRIKQVAEREHVTYDNDGIDALVRLGKGDMRRSINLLQSVGMGSLHTGAADGSKSDVVCTEHAVYMCAGEATPKQIELVLQWLLNEPIAAAFEKISTLQREHGLALLDLVNSCAERVVFMQAPVRAKVALVAQLADLEYRLSSGCSETLQLGALVGAFQPLRAAVAAAAQ